MEALTITNAIVELAIKEQSSNSNYRDITVQLPVMKQPVSESDNNASNLTSNELEDYLLNKIPFNIITYQGTEIFSLNITFTENNNNINPSEELDFIL